MYKKRKKIFEGANWIDTKPVYINLIDTSTDLIIVPTNVSKSNYIKKIYDIFIKDIPWFMFMVGCLLWCISTVTSEYINMNTDHDIYTNDSICENNFDNKPSNSCETTDLCKIDNEYNIKEPFWKRYFR